MPDDDIIELTEVVKPGKKSRGGQPDFGADLDAMLNGFGDESVASLKSPPAAPFKASPTAASAAEDIDELLDLGEKPADGHMVDPDEELELPELSDLDALLQELGVDDAPADAVPVDDVTKGFDELDAQPAPAAPVPQATPEQNVAPAPISPDDDIETLMAAMQDLPAESDPAVLPTAPQAQPDPAAPLSEPPASPAVPAAGAINPEDIVALDPGTLAASVSLAAATPPAVPEPVPKPVAAPEFESETGGTVASVHKAALEISVAPVKPSMELTSKPAAESVAASALPAAPASVDDIDSLMADLNAAPVTTAPTAPAVPSVEDLDIASILEDAEAALPEPPSPVAPEVSLSEAAFVSTESAAQPFEDDDIEFNQLDAILDQVLASAPKPRVTATATVSAPVSAAGLAAPPAAAVDAPLEEGAATALSIPEFEDIDVGAMLVEADAKQSVKPEPVIQDVGAMLEEAEIKQKAKPVITATAPPTALPASELASLKSDNAYLRNQLDKLQREMSDLQTNIEKYAAAAAAKVIREEMAALLSAELE